MNATAPCGCSLNCNVKSRSTGRAVLFRQDQDDIGGADRRNGEPTTAGLGPVNHAGLSSFYFSAAFRLRPVR